MLYLGIHKIHTYFMHTQTRSAMQLGSVTFSRAMQVPLGHDTVYCTGTFWAFIVLVGICESRSQIATACHGRPRPPHITSIATVANNNTVCIPVLVVACTVCLSGYCTSQRPRSYTWCPAKTALYCVRFRAISVDSGPSSFWNVFLLSVATITPDVAVHVACRGLFVSSAISPK